MRLRAVGSCIWIIHNEAIQIYETATMKLDEQLSKKFSNQHILDALMLPCGDLLVATEKHLAVWKKGY